MRKKRDFLEVLIANEQVRLEREIEEVLLRYATLSPNEALHILNSLPGRYDVPFKSEHDAVRFYSKLLSYVTKTAVTVELKSGSLGIVPVRSTPPENTSRSNLTRPPFNAEYVLYLLLRREERDEIVGDLIEAYGKVLKRFDKRRADMWFYKQVIGSLVPLFWRAVLRIGALVWVGRVLRRFIS